MTEREAIKELEFNKPFTANKKLNEAIEIAIKALEEVKKIKELGDCYIIPKNSTWEVNGIDILKTVEEIKKLKGEDMAQIDEKTFENLTIEDVNMYQIHQEYGITWSDIYAEKLVNVVTKKIVDERIAEKMKGSD